MPTLQWLLGDIIINDDLLADARKNAVMVRMSLSTKENIEVGKFRYLIPPPPEIPPEEPKGKNAKKAAKK